MSNVFSTHIFCCFVLSVHYTLKAESLVSIPDQRQFFRLYPTKSKTPLKFWSHVLSIIYPQTNVFIALRIYTLFLLWGIRSSYTENSITHNLIRHITWTVLWFKKNRFGNYHTQKNLDYILQYSMASKF